GRRGAGPASRSPVLAYGCTTPSAVTRTTSPLVSPTITPPLRSTVMPSGPSIPVARIATGPATGGLAASPARAAAPSPRRAPSSTFRPIIARTVSILSPPPPRQTLPPPPPPAPPPPPPPPPP